MEQSEQEQLPKLESVIPNYFKPTLSGSEAEKFCSNIFEEANPHPLNITRNGNEGFYFINDVLSSQECAFLRNSIDSCDALSFWNAAGNSNLEAKAFRNADTIEVKQSTLSNIIWKRVEALLKDVEIVIEKNDYDNELWERELPGSWFPHSVNENFLFAKYPSGGHFAPHTDGRAIHNFNTRSFLSVIIFLNDIPVSYGGGTRFYSRDALQNLAQDSSGRWICGQESCVVGEVAAVSGRMLIFNQNLVHEGVCCKDPHFKYIIRSDIMFERNPAVCNSEADIRAYGIFQRAEALAETGHVAEAVPLFRQAFKTSPALAEMMGQ